MYAFICKFVQIKNENVVPKIYFAIRYRLQYHSISVVYNLLVGLRYKNVLKFSNFFSDWPLME